MPSRYVIGGLSAMRAVVDGPERHADVDNSPHTAAGGGVVISARAIGSVAYRAALDCYGIVELVPQDLRSRVGRRLGHAPPPDARDGITVQTHGEKVTITLHVVMEYGLPIAEVAHNAIRAVHFAVTQAIGARPLAVNVHVHSLRFNGGMETGAGAV